MSIARPAILCLINSAPYSRVYFEELRPHLETRGFDVFFALDSHLTDVLDANGKEIENGFYFTDFCANHPKLSPKDLERVDLRWDTMLSDFDRFLTMDIPVPLPKIGPLTYDQIPLLLERFFADIFDKAAPVAVIYEQVSNCFAVAANDVARKRGIPFFSLAPGRIAGRVEVSPTGALQDHVTVAGIWERVKREGAEPESRELAEEYIRNVLDQIPDYMRPGGEGEVLGRTNLLSKYVNLPKLRMIVRALAYRRHCREDLKLAFQFGDPIDVSWARFRRSWHRKFRVRQVSRYYRDAPSPGAYFLYPLHFHPEASTSVLAPDFIDEMSVIKAIAFRLPAHVKLAVKEHPSAIALQSTEFYRQLDALPNVELIGPGANSKRLARDAIGVICVTSTLGFEAAALNKPVVCLGDVLYGYFPNVRMIQHYGELRNAIDWAMGYEPIDPEEIASAMTAYVEFTDPGTFSFGGSLGDEKAQSNIAGIIAARLAAPGSLMSANQPAALNE